MWRGRSAWKASASLLTPGWQRSQVSPGGILGHTPFLVPVLASVLCHPLPAAPVGGSTVLGERVGAQLLGFVPSREISGSPGGTGGAWWHAAVRSQPGHALGLPCQLDGWLGFFRSDGPRSPTASRVMLLCSGIPKQRDASASRGALSPLHPPHLRCRHCYRGVF